MELKQHLLPVLMIFAPVLGYIPQYRDIQKSGNPTGFSTLVSFILLVSNIVRVFYWYGERFETFLLLQSLLMIVAQLALLSLCVDLRRKMGLSSRSTNILNPNTFWNWPYIINYISFLGVLTAGLTALTVMFGNQQWFIQMIGTVALGVEATLGVPQVYANYKNKSAKGLSLFLIFTWFAGDALKTYVFVSEGAPWQFVGCGTFQLFIDCIVLAQLAYYRN